MNTDFFFTFMMFTMMNKSNAPIPMSTVLSSLDIVPAPMRFMVQAQAIQQVEQTCIAEDNTLRDQVRRMVSDNNIDGAEVAKDYPRVAELLGPGTPAPKSP